MAGNVVIINDDRVWRELRKKVKDIGSYRVKVGVIGSKQQDGNGATMADILAFHELGTENMISRAPIRTTFTHRAEDIRAVCYQLAKGLLVDRFTVPQAMGILGAWLQSAIQNSIRERVIVQELKPSTLARKAAKGNDNPTALVETGRLINSITWARERR